MGTGEEETTKEGLRALCFGQASHRDRVLLLLDRVHGTSCLDKRYHSRKKISRWASVSVCRGGWGCLLNASMSEPIVNGSSSSNSGSTGGGWGSSAAAPLPNRLPGARVPSPGPCPWFGSSSHLAHPILWHPAMLELGRARQHKPTKKHELYKTLGSDVTHRHFGLAHMFRPVLSRQETLSACDLQQNGLSSA